jgi:cobyrinic acid a,c-diamide synthase
MLLLDCPALRGHPHRDTLMPEASELAQSLASGHNFHRSQFERDEKQKYLCKRFHGSFPVTLAI